jgi:hypothetical protein
MTLEAGAKGRNVRFYLAQKRSFPLLCIVKNWSNALHYTRIEESEGRKSRWALWRRAKVQIWTTLYPLWGNVNDLNTFLTL